MFPLLPLGQIVAAPGALAALERAKQPPTCFLARHAIGDWGELEPSHVAENGHAEEDWLQAESEVAGSNERKALRASTSRSLWPKIVRDDDGLDHRVVENDAQTTGGKP